MLKVSNKKVKKVLQNKMFSLSPQYLKCQYFKIIGGERVSGSRISREAPLADCILAQSLDPTNTGKTTFASMLTIEIARLSAYCILKQAVPRVVHI